MTSKELAEILLGTVMIGGWLAFSWHVSRQAFEYMAGFTACGVLSIPYHLYMARTKDG